MEICLNLLQLHNNFRAKFKLTPLIYNSRLSASSLVAVTYMNKRNELNHYGPAMKSPWRRMNETGYAYKKAAENIAMGDVSESEIFKLWTSDYLHRANIFGPYKDIGFARVGNYWCVDFGSLK